MQIYWTKINEIKQENDDVYTYYLDCPQGFTWDEGAHTHLGLKGFNAGEKPNRALVRHMSISTMPDEARIGITTRIKETCSEFKTFLKTHQTGDEVALFKTHSNVPLKRDNQNIYLLSAGVGLATFRPLVLEYFKENKAIKQIHALNIDSTQQYLFQDLFINDELKKFTCDFLNSRQHYYDAVNELAQDKSGLYYIVGSDEFLQENIKLLLGRGIRHTQIILDKRQGQMADFLPNEVRA